MKKITDIQNLLTCFLTRKRFYCIIIVCFCFVFASSSTNAHNKPVTSTGLSTEHKLKIIRSFIIPKSEIIDCEYKMFDVNYKNRSIPGASSKDLKILIYVDSSDIPLWIKDKDDMLTSFPHSIEWLKEIVSMKQFEVIESYTFSTYYKKTAESELTYWVNEENGVILIKYQLL